MFRIIDFKSLLKYVAIATTFVSIVTYEVVRRFWTEDWPIMKMLSIATWVSVGIVFIITTNAIARSLWKVVKKFDTSLYPDLNGQWVGEIITEGAHPLTIPVRAVVKQTLLQTLIDIHTETSKSVTLESTPAVDGGQCKLYYMYRSIPQNPARPPYLGTTLFDVRRVQEQNLHYMELSGTYFTDRKTVGRIRLRQIGHDANVDVSFY